MESELEKIASVVEAAEPRVTSPVVPCNNNWCEEYNFDDVNMLLGGKNKKKFPDQKRGKLAIIMPKPRVL